MPESKSVEPKQISIARFEKKDWIVVKPQHVRYKIVNFKHWDRYDGKSPRGGKVIFAYDNGDAMTLIQMSYGAYFIDGKVKFNGSSRFVYRLKVKNGKLIVWKLAETNGVRSVRNVSTKIENVKKQLFSFGKRNIYKNRIPTKENLAANELELVAQEMGTDFNINEYQDKFPILRVEERVIKGANKRLNQIIKHFLRRNGIRFEYTTDAFENIRIACYPFSADFQLKNQAISSLYSRHFLHGDIKYVIKKCFGFDNRNLVKLVCDKIKKDQNFEVLQVGLALKGLIPVDYFYKAIAANLSKLREIDGFFNSPVKMKDVRALLKNYNPARILKLVLDSGFSDWNFSDSVSMYAQAKDIEGFKLVEKPKNWHEIHEQLNRVRPAKMGGYPDLKLPVSKKYKEIDGLEYEGFKLEVPKHSKDLAAYSDKMNNCIRGYGAQVVNGYCNLLGIYKNGELAYNISINGTTLGQFLGKRNSLPPDEDRAKILKLLVDKGIVTDKTVFAQEYPAVFAAEQGVEVPF